MHNILVPVDGSIHALKAAHIACDFAQKYEGRVSLLYVIPKSISAQKLLKLAAAKTYGPKLKALLQAQLKTQNGMATPATIKAAGEKILAQAAGTLARQGIIANVLPLARGNVVQAVLDHIDQIQASVVVMGSRGASEQEQAAFGSVSHAIFQRAECTCLAVK